MDVVRLHQAGIAYAVATLGTATTAEHLKRIFRLVNEVVFAFDGDRDVAGSKGDAARLRVFARLERIFVGSREQPVPEAAAAPAPRARVA